MERVDVARLSPGSGQRGEVEVCRARLTCRRKRGRQIESPPMIFLTKTSAGSGGTTASERGQGAWPSEAGILEGVARPSERQVARR